MFLSLQKPGIYFKFLIDFFMQLFYNPELKENDQEIVFDKKESKHIIKVLRKTINDKLLITNGKGFLFKSEITDSNHNKCKAKIIEKTYFPPSDFHLHIAIAPTKKNDRFEWFLEKSTEMGIHQITPIICEHSERRKVNLDRFNRIIQSAMKQSLQYYIPKLEKPVSFNEFISKEINGNKFIAHCEESAKDFLQHKIKPKTEIVILIGPEGDFSSSEIQEAIATGFEPISLGKNRLRTETAAIAACHTVYLANQF